MSDVARRLKERTEKVLVLPTSGESIRIRKLDHLKFIKQGGGILVAAIEAAVRDEQAKVPDEQGSEYVARLLQFCMVEPTLHLGDPETCPEDAVTLAHLSEDLAWLIDQVLTFNAMSKEAAAIAASFRDAVRDAAGRDGASLRSPADGVPPDGSLGVDAEPRPISAGTAAEERTSAPSE